MATKNKKNNKTTPLVMIYTDGSCSPNPGRGGWAGILTYQNYKQVISGGFQYTTSNRMEMIALIKCLEALTHPHVVHLYSDSRYLVKPIQQGKIKKWIKASDSGKFIRNIDLWRKILYFNRDHTIIANWIKGHNNNTNNEHCDKLAKIMATTTNPTLLEEDTEYIKSLKLNAPHVTQQNYLLQPA